MASKRVTAYSVAKASGVSQATVSYVFNNTPNQKITPETRARVLAAAAALNYRPFEPARTLSSGRSSLVLFLVPDFPLGHTMSLLLDHLADMLRSNGKTLITYRIPDGTRLGQLASTVSPWAVISVLPLDIEEVEELKRQGIAVEVLALQEPHRSSDAVLNSQEAIGALQAEYLIEKGHERLGFAMPANIKFTPFAAPRLVGVRRAIELRGLSEPVVRVVGSGVSAPGTAVQEWVTAGVTAVCAYNDEIAFEVLAGAREASLTVPDSLAVIGVDDLPLARLVSPPLTSIRVDMEHLARRLVVRLLSLDALESDGHDSTTIVIRESA